MILTPIDDKIHIRTDGTRRQVAIYNPATGALEIVTNGERCEIPLVELVEAGKRLGAVKVSMNGGT